MFYLVTSWGQGPRLSLAGPHRHTDSTLKWSALSESKCLSDTFQPPVSDDVVGLTFNGPVSAWYMRITGHLTCNCTKLIVFLQLHSISGGVKWAGGQRGRRERRESREVRRVRWFFISRRATCGDELMLRCVSQCSTRYHAKLIFLCVKWQKRRDGGCNPTAPSDGLKCPFTDTTCHVKHTFLKNDYKRDTIQNYIMCICGYC